MKLTVAVLLALSAHAATLVRIQCGGPGGKDAQGNVWQPDAYFTGGARWGAAEQAASGGLPLPPLPYNTLRYSAYPAGAAFSYAIPLPAGSYRLTLFFVEPKKTGPSQRVFSVSVNGAALITPLDLFTQAGGGTKPDAASSLLVTTGPTLQIVLTPSVGNAVISGIQVEDVTPPPPASATPSNCEMRWDSGTGGAIGTGVFAAMGCENVSGASLRITRVTCRSDIAGQVLDLQVIVNGAYQSLLTSPFACTPERGEGVPLPGASYPDGAILWFFVRVVQDTVSPFFTPQAIVAAVVRQQ